MASTVIQFPDGNRENKEILTAYEKYGLKVLAYDSGIVDANGNKVYDVRYLHDGVYQGIPDNELWDTAKKGLTDGIHDRITNEEYYVVSEEIKVDGKGHSLALREGNRVSIAENYNKYLNGLQKEEVVTQEQVLDFPKEVGVATEVPTADISNVEQVKHEDIVPPMDFVVDQSAAIPSVNPSVSIQPASDLPNLEAAQTIPTTPIIEEAPVVSNVVPFPNVQQESASLVKDEPVVSSKPASASSGNVEESAVKDSYMKRIDLLEERSFKAKEEFIKVVTDSYEAYRKELEDIKDEIAENLTQSKMIRGSAERALRKAEEYRASNTVQMPTEEEGRSLAA